MKVDLTVYEKVRLVIVGEYLSRFTVVKTVCSARLRWVLTGDSHKHFFNYEHRLVNIYKIFVYLIDFVPSVHIHTS